MAAIKKDTKYKLIIIGGWILFLAAVALFLFTGDTMKLLKTVFFNDLSQEELSDTLGDLGWRGYLTVTILSALQVVCSFLSAEPVQVLSGFTFGFWLGVLWCWIGCFIGNTVIFLLKKSFSNQLDHFFNKKLRLDFDKLSRSRKYILIIFIMYILPAIPYGMICFFAASTGMKYRRYTLVTALGSLPSICIGVGLGQVAIASTWTLSVLVFAILMVFLIVVMVKKDILIEKLNNYAEKTKGPKNAIPNTNRFLLAIVYYVLRIYYILCGVRIKSVNKVGKLEKPSIVLCNHGSFIDFIFAAKLLRKHKPKFVAARLYFYSKPLRWLIKSIGGFPKSMFALDAESTKTSLHVLRSGNLLAMMPEARLSTTGRFEDIQENTYSFIKKTAVTVYTIKFSGDYFADPKWGKGFRRGAVVEAEMDILFTADEIKKSTVEEIKQGVEQRLYYNEFEWIKDRPQLNYRSKRMAEGLENILTVCPVCGQKYTLQTKQDKISCEKCGYLTSLDNRYQFTGDFRFKDLTQWYDWQTGLMQKEIAENENFSLSSDVELRLPSNGKGLTRHGGYGVCTLSRDGLQYTGTKDGQEVHLTYSLSGIYRLLFGAGENFETYNGTEILYFVPTEKRSAVDWYIASKLLHNEVCARPNVHG